MTVETHLAALSRKHQELESAINSALLHPSTSDERIQRLKREKLRIKDEMARLKQ